MAAIDFPSNPTIGELYTQNGKTWEWDGTSWINLSFTTGTQGIQGRQGITGAQGIQGTEGSFGGATFDYTFSNLTSGDPGAGGIRLNNAATASATQLLIDDLDDNGVDIQTFL